VAQIPNTVTLQRVRDALVEQIAIYAYSAKTDPNLVDKGMGGVSALYGFALSLFPPDEAERIVNDGQEGCQKLLDANQLKALLENSGLGGD